MKKLGDNWDEAVFPIAYLITFRTYGTWLHGDRRGSVDTHRRKNVYGLPKIEPNPSLQSKMSSSRSLPAFELDKCGRESVERAIKEVCRYRDYELLALNVRSNHVHIVVSANKKPEDVANEFKRYATRKLRESY